MSEINIKKIDWLSVIILSILISLGLGNIFSSSQIYLLDSIFSFNPFTKQLFFAIILHGKLVQQITLGKPRLILIN